MFTYLRTFELPLSLLALLAVPAYGNLPYNPTRVLLSPNHAGELVYVLQPTSTSSSSFRLLSLNTTTTLHASSLPYKTISTSLSFLRGDDGKAFTPVIDDWGSICVYAGSCSDGARGAELWRFTQNNKTLNGDGDWTKETLSNSGLEVGGGLTGPNYLSSGISFSSSVGGGPNSSDVYVFGGMCPTTTTASSDVWTTSADYSNSMLKMTTAMVSSSASATTDYKLGITTGRGPPIAEAGFTITGLSPSFTNSTGGDQTRQQNFVLLGGHTQEAFINTSQVAIFSLPEESWSFRPVNSPNQTNIDPRSGHTAVLTPDGKKLLVYGGWVGDVGTPAEPQLVILEVGEGYGGDGDWRWSTLERTGSGLDNGAGVYGHGAVMLPGGVMMVVGGYSIPAPSKFQMKRADQSLNNRNLFFNITSNAWIVSYTKPLASSTSLNSKNEGAGYLTPSKKAGLGAGLGLGLAAIVGAGIVWFWYSRRLKRRLEAREEELRELALGAQRFHSSGLGLGGIDGRGGEKSALEWMGEQQRTARNTHPSTTGGAPRSGGFGEGPGWKEYGGTEAERTGLLVEIPSPTRGLRRSLHSRGAYQQTPRLDEQRRSLASSNIHPIEERDEHEGATLDSGAADVGRPQSMPTINVVATAPQLDPFSDPAPLGSHPVPSRTPSPGSSARDREIEVQNWVSDWNAADALLYNNGRTSPDKADRTSSTLSELSVQSDMSFHSIQRSAGTLSRSISQRSAAFFGTNPFSSASNTTNSSPTFDRPSSATGGRRSPTTSHNRPNYRRSQSLTLASRHSRNLSDISNPIVTTFPQLQTEGEALLGGRPELSPTMPESPTKSRNKRTGWMGSMRRALTGTGGDRSHSTSPDSGARSVSSSPTKHHRDLNQDGAREADLPRRAASAGAMLWRRRQGARDWDVEGRGGSYAAGGRSTEREEPGGEGTDAEGEEEWDVEAAVERRVVQVMFTVPKEKLRVVNAEVDRLSVSDVGDGDVVVEKGQGHGHGKREEGTEGRVEGDVKGDGKGKAKAKDVQVHEG
ncbi:hypothetical protein MMC16_007292 [Acarospora aff. strigata]|nr:hypothetical protein [Acarospora aff. strigata]